tara:strand:- start:20194 stop:20547 length:354 start_codon:yes stop_codon:yes gene_type:complete
MKFYKITSALAVMTYSILGILTITSVMWDTSVLIYNVILGGIFITIGVYIFFKAKNISEIIPLINFNDNGEKQNRGKSASRLLFLERLFVLVNLVIGMVFLYGIGTRFFVEKMPIFG